VSWDGAEGASHYSQSQHVEGSALEGRLEGAHFVENNSERPDVAFEVVGPVLDDLRAEVVGRAHHRFQIFCCVLQHASNPKVSKFYDVILGKEDILALQVPMEDLAIVDVLDCQANLGEPTEDLLLREVAALLLLDPLLQVTAYPL